MEDSDFNETQAQARLRLAALERLEALYRLREQAEEASRPAMLASIEDLIAMERRALSRDTDSEPA